MPGSRFTARSTLAPVTTPPARSSTAATKRASSTRSRSPAGAAGGPGFPTRRALRWSPLGTRALGGHTRGRLNGQTIALDEIKRPIHQRQLLVIDPGFVAGLPGPIGQAMNKSIGREFDRHQAGVDRNVVERISVVALSGPVDVDARFCRGEEGGAERAAAIIKRISPLPCCAGTSNRRRTARAFPKAAR